MIDYASTAQEIWEADQRTPALPFSPRWLRERIVKSDDWMEELEQLNLKEVRKASQKMRDNVAALADDLGVKIPQKAGAWRQTQALLDLVFDIQEQLFERGGYRQAWVEEEENWLP